MRFFHTRMIRHGEKELSSGRIINAYNEKVLYLGKGRLFRLKKYPIFKRFTPMIIPKMEAIAKANKRRAVPKMPNPPPPPRYRANDPERIRLAREKYPDADQEPLPTHRKVYVILGWIVFIVTLPLSIPAALVVGTILYICWGDE